MRLLISTHGFYQLQVFMAIKELSLFSFLFLAIGFISPHCRRFTLSIRSPSYQPCGYGLTPPPHLTFTFKQINTLSINKIKRLKWNVFLLFQINILRNFKNATFYIDCFLYWVDYMLFPIQYFILSRDKQQLTVKRILLRPFILTLPRR